MKHIIVFFIAFLTSALAIAQDAWQLKKNSNGIKIYTQDYPNSKFKEYKAQMTVKTSIETVKSVILDAENLKNWNYKTSKSSLIKKIDEDNYIFYLYNDMPWPVMNRDHISDVKVTYPNEKSIRISITPNNDMLPKYDGVVRITNFKGYWLLEELDKGVRITNQLFGDPEGGVPSWLVNSKLIKSPFTAFSNLKKLLKSKQN